VKVRALYPLAVALGMWGSAAASAGQPPAPFPAAVANPNQQLADAVAARLRAANAAPGADVTIVAQDGTVLLSGTARDAAHKEQIVALAKTVSGVVSVRDTLTATGSSVVRVQAPPLAAPVPPTPVVPQPVVISGPGAPVVEPAPLGVPGQITPDLQAPPLPPHAWPTYAPYNNASRIAYPEAYPYNAFPFIGPYYPFPKVPLGWRKVVLEWEDGHWYLGRASAPHDYWRVRFW
jgi:hypothetical protein